jgi:hypothetical protein
MISKRMIMDGNNNPKPPNDGRKLEDKYLSFKRVVSEGSTEEGEVLPKEEEASLIAAAERLQRVLSERQWFKIPVVL